MDKLVGCRSLCRYVPAGVVRRDRGAEGPAESRFTGYQTPGKLREQDLGQLELQGSRFGCEECAPR